LSISEQRLINCPQCQHPQSVTIWSSINVLLNPEGRNQLFNGEINHFHCAKCGHESLIPLPLLYHDPERQIAAHYFPPRSIEKAEFLNQFDSQGKFRAGDQVDFEVPEYLKDVHVVFNLDELITYIIFRETLLEFHEHESSNQEFNPDNPLPDSYN